MPLRRVLILLCTAASKVHPANVVPVLYPVAGSESTGSAGDGSSALVGRAWRHTRHDDALGTGGWFAFSFLLAVTLSTFREYLISNDNLEGGP